MCSGVELRLSPVFFGTPRFLIGQTVLVILWIVTNVIAVSLRWDP